MDAGFPTDQTPDENEPTVQKGKKVASYLVRVNIWGDTAQPLTTAEVAGIVQREVASHVRGTDVAVTTSAERLDK